MTPFQHAKNVVRIECVGRIFTVSLVSSVLRFPLEVAPSAERADYVALVARMVIASEIASALRNEDCRIAALLDQADLAGQALFHGDPDQPKFTHLGQVSAFCREQAALHTVDCMPRCQSELTQTTERSSKPSSE